MTLKKFICSYHHACPIEAEYFSCWAEDAAHATEQCRDANPEAIDIECRRVGKREWNNRC